MTESSSVLASNLHSGSGALVLFSRFTPVRANRFLNLENRLLKIASTFGSNEPVGKFRQPIKDPVPGKFKQCHCVVRSGCYDDPIHQP